MNLNCEHNPYNSQDFSRSKSQKRNFDLKTITPLEIQDITSQGISVKTQFKKLSNNKIKSTPQITLLEESKESTQTQSPKLVSFNNEEDDDDLIIVRKKRRIIETSPTQEDKSQLRKITKNTKEYHGKKLKNVFDKMQRDIDAYIPSFQYQCDDDERLTILFIQDVLAEAQNLANKKRKEKGWGNYQNIISQNDVQFAVKLIIINKVRTQREKEFAQKFLKYFQLSYQIELPLFKDFMF